jgi:hypothetical protein
MPAKVFISYRRDDSKYQARMIHEAFCHVLSREDVFMDVDSIPPGANFRKILGDWVGKCDVLLALVGPGWIDATDGKTGRRRLDNPSDFVRIEIGEALARDIPVVPVLIDGAPMPNIDLLTDDLKGLVDRQAEVVEYRTFEADVEGLIKKLGLTQRLGQPGGSRPGPAAEPSPPGPIPEPPAERGGAKVKPWLVGSSAVGVAAVVALVAWMFVLRPVLDERRAREIIASSPNAPAQIGASQPLTGSYHFPVTTGGSVTGIKNGIDRRQFLDELKNPTVIKKLADMAKGEVGWNAPLDTKFVQLETPFNRAMARGHSLAQALLSTSEDPRLGYYQGGPNGPYSRPVTTAEFEDFMQNILPEILAGSNKSEELLGFVATGNALAPISDTQIARGTRFVGDLPTEIAGHPQSYFVEGPLRFPFKRLQGGESIPLPGAGEPPEHMEGDVEGNGPTGGKFNVGSGTPIAPQGERETITLSNGQKVNVNKKVAEQFRGFFNDLIKFGAPVRNLAGFGVSENASQHPIGFAVDWAQHSRDVVVFDVRNWIDNNRVALKKLEQRWGLSGGENWSNPDTGHFAVERIFGEQHLAASQKASQTD